MLQWVERLGPGPAQSSHERLEHEDVIRIVPKNPRASQLVIRVGRSDPHFDAYAGKRAAFDDLPISIDLVVQVCEGVKAGRLHELLWERNGTILGAKSELELPGEVMYSQIFTLGYHFWKLFGSMQPRTVQYEPY